MQNVQNRISDIIQKFEQKSAAFQPQNSSQSMDSRPGPGKIPESQAQPAAPGQAARRAVSFSRELEGLIQQTSTQEGVSPDLLRAVIQTESAGRPDAVSSAGALGLMQLMPGTARQLGVDPLDPKQNVQGGARYLREMAEQFGDLDLALAAYNAGPGAVRRHGGVPPYAETQAYIKKVRGMLADHKR